MRSDQNPSKVLRNIVDGTPYTAIDVFGPTIELISDPDDPGADFCVMRGVLPPGAVVPLHSHDHHEDFLILAGTQQVLVEDAHGLQWRDMQAGDYVHIPGGNQHAHRNVSDEPAVDLVITSTRLGRFFRELARPDVGQRGPLTPDDLGQLIALSTKYGYILGTPEQNAAVGIELGFGLMTIFHDQNGAIGVPAILTPERQRPLTVATKLPPAKLVRAVERARHHLLRLHQRLAPAPAVMMELIFAAWTLRDLQPGHDQRIRVGGSTHRREL